MKIILPKILVAPPSLTYPLFFLAGPVRGGGDWQKTACEMLHKQVGGEFSVAVPNRWDEGHPMYQYRSGGLLDVFKDKKQTYWERHYLEIASTKGCIMFWLACESKTHPRMEDLPYARDTYGELGEWRARLMANRRLRVVIGAENDFPGLAVIKANFDDALKGTLPIYDNLEATIKAAVQNATGKIPAAK